MQVMLPRSFRCGAYVAETVVCDLELSDCVSHFYRPQAVWRLCEGCNNYGSSYCCPPFSGEPCGEAFGRYDHFAFVVSKIEVNKSHIADGVDVAEMVVNAECKRIKGYLLEYERLTGGRALVGVGRCRECGEDCHRAEGLPCRCPDTMRLSLGAAGFDVTMMLRSLCGIELQWASAGTMPPYLVFAAGLIF